MTNLNKKDSDSNSPVTEEQIKNIFSNSLEASLDPSRFTEDFNFVSNAAPIKLSEDLNFSVGQPEIGQRISFQKLREPGVLANPKLQKGDDVMLGPNAKNGSSLKDLNTTGRFPTFSGINTGLPGLRYMVSNDSLLDKKILNSDSRSIKDEMSKAEIGSVQVSLGDNVIINDNITFQQRLSRRKIEKIELPQDKISEKILKFKLKGHGSNSNSNFVSKFQGEFQKTMKSSFQSTKQLNLNVDSDNEIFKKNPDINQIFQSIKQTSHFLKRREAVQKSIDTSQDTYNLVELKRPTQKYDSKDPKNLPYTLIDSVPSLSAAVFQQRESSQKTASPASLPFPLQRYGAFSNNGYGNRVYQYIDIYRLCLYIYSVYI